MAGAITRSSSSMTRSLRMSVQNLDPEVLQSGFRGDLFTYVGLAKFRKIAGEYLSEFWWRISTASFSASFYEGSAPPPPKKKKIHAQNRWHSSPISLSRTQKLFTPIFCLRERAKNPDRRSKETASLTVQSNKLLRRNSNFTTHCWAEDHMEQASRDFTSSVVREKAPEGERNRESQSEDREAKTEK